VLEIAADVQLIDLSAGRLLIVWNRPTPAHSK
jgi:hypothetical protein